MRCYFRRRNGLPDLKESLSLKVRLYEDKCRKCDDIGGANAAMYTEIYTFEVRSAFLASFLQTNWILYYYYVQ